MIISYIQFFHLIKNTFINNKKRLVLVSKVVAYLIPLRSALKESAPTLGNKEKERMYKILNSNNPKFLNYGLKLSDIEKIARQFQQENKITLNQAIEIFKLLINSDVHDEKFLGVFILNRFKKNFTESIVDLFHDAYTKYCDTWALCDSTMIRVIGPFLGKKGNEIIARETVENWSNSKHLWIRRASLVILIKLTMINKSFEEEWVFTIIKKMLQSPEEYIQKGVGWLLKTCSNYKPDLIFDYLVKNKGKLPRLILRYASEKMSKERRNQILKKFSTN